MKEKFFDRLRTLPPTGQSFHTALQGCANYGIMAGISEHEIFVLVRASIPSGGNRKVADKEIWDAIKTAVADVPNYTGNRRSGYNVALPQKPISNGQAKRTEIIESSEISDEADLWESSPVRIDWEPSEDTFRFLERMFKPNEMVFIGDRETPGIVGTNIRTAKDWIDYFRQGGKTEPHIIINPLSGESAPTKSGDKQTYRGDLCVKAFKYCLVEFDDLTREDQIKFWMSQSARKLPVACLVDTGGKSIHAWLRLSGIASMDDWAKEIKSKLYDQFLIPLGVDAACSNPARLSRLPGHLRNGKYQRILWMNTPEEGR
jgi:hypothetical protein